MAHGIGSLENPLARATKTTFTRDMAGLRAGYVGDRHGEIERAGDARRDH